MLEEVKKELTSIFGSRVAFHKIERLLYSSDLASLPDIIRKQINPVPDAVVQPVSNDELIALLGLAKKYKIPLVPRGTGTSGYGGAIPTKGGIVVDFGKFNRVIGIDKAEQVAVVEPGVVWKNLEDELRGYGLALRLYPGSAVSSTVAGWIANGGGVGIGSYEYGYFRDNVIEVELITPGGAKRITHNDIGLVDGMSGTTGFITRVKLALREYEEQSKLLAAFSSLDQMVRVFEETRQQGLPLWEAGYKNPLNVWLTHKAVDKQSRKIPTIHGVAKAPGLPEDKFIVLFVYPESRDKVVRDNLVHIVRSQSGEVLDEKLAEFEWEERFYSMRLKAVGPSIVPSEVIVPTRNLFRFVNDLESVIKRIAHNGTLVNRGEEVAFLGYVLDDERRRGFLLAFSSVLISLKAAKKQGGRPYAAGMLLAGYAERILGRDSVLKAHAFKREVDPDHIVNPGKVFPGHIDKNSPVKKFNRMINFGSSQFGLILIRAVDALFGGKPFSLVANRRNRMGDVPFAKEVVWDAFACTNCGYCRGECTEFNAIGWESSSPRGKFHFLREYVKGNVELDERMAEMFFVCTTCRRCNQVCQAMIPIDEYWTLALRPAIWRKGFSPPMIFQAQAYNIVTQHNPGGFQQSERKGWMPPDLKYEEEGEVGYWVGCSSSFSSATRNIAVNTMRILNKAGIRPVYLGSDEWCCGGALYTVGCYDEVLETVKNNIEALNRRGVKTLITSCSGCWLNLSHYYPIFARNLNMKFELDIKHQTEVVSTLLGEGRIKFKFPLKLKVTYHDPCHIGRGGGIFDPPRKILMSIPDLELIEMPRNREHAACCGRHVMRYPRLGIPINTSRVTEAKSTGASAIISACPTCETNLRIGITEAGARLEVLDITDLVCESMGLPTLVVGKLAKLLEN